MLSKSIYLFLSNVIGYGIRILLPIFLVRILTKEDFGAYNQFFLLEVLISTVFQMGINQSLYYFVPRDMENAGAYLINSLWLNVFVFTMAFTLVWFFKAEIATQMGMKIIYVFFWYLAAHSTFMMLNVSILSYLTARQKIVQASILTILREVLASIATLLAAYFTRDLQKIILALVISRGLVLIIGILYVHFRLDGFRAKRYFFGIWEQVKYGLVLGFGGTIWIYSLRLHELMVSRSYDIETYAVYSAGCKEIPVLQFVSQAISAVALGQFALLVKNEDWDGVKELWNKILGTVYGIAIPFVIFLLLISGPLVIAMFTNDYAGAIPIFQIKTLGKMALVLNSTLVLRAMDRNDVTLKINAALFVLLPFALYGGMKVAGLVGIAAVNMIFLLVTRVITQAYLNRITPVHLAYVAPWNDVLNFYSEVFRKSQSWVSQAVNKIR